MKGVSGSIAARWQANACLPASGESLPMPGEAIQSSRRLVTVAGKRYMRDAG